MIARGACPLILLLAATSAAAAPGPAEPGRANPVDAAIRGGVRYLKSSQNADGTWPGAYGNRLGGVALAGLALTLADVPAEDPAVQRVATFVRHRTPEEWQTYDLALAIMFLDRLTRAAAHQGQERELKATKPSKLPKVPKRSKQLKSGRVLMADQIDDSALIVLLGRRILQGQGPGGTWTYRSYTPGDGDHSNTQFAVLGLWVAGQHGLDVGPGLQRCAQHFRQVQTDQGGWGYMGQGGDRPSMTCAGLTALAAGLGMQTELTARRGVPRARGPQQAAADLNIAAGFRRLEQYLLQDRQGPGPWDEREAMDQWLPGVELVFRGQRDYYFLWSLERVGVLFGTERIGQVEWYPWGVRRLLPAQKADGSWTGNYDAVISTSFALLFLCRANIAPELSQALTGRFNPEAGMKAYKPGEEAQKALRALAGRAGKPAGKADVAGPGDSSETPKTDATPKNLRQASLAQLLDALADDSPPAGRQAAAAQLAHRQPTYAEVKPHLPALRRLAGSPDEKTASAARDQLANAFQRAPMSHCLYWLGQDEAGLGEVIWRQIDGRIARADDARKAEYRKVAAAVLGEEAYPPASRQAGIELLVRMGGKDSADPLIDVLLELPRELWPAAGQALKKLTGKDFGPRLGDAATGLFEAHKQWRSWQTGTKQ